MKQVATRRDRLSLWHLSWPIAIELFLQFLMGTIDTVMVSRIGDQAVSASGISNQLITAAMTLFALISAGVSIVLAQKWGRGDLEGARRVAIIAIQANLAAGLAVSLFFAIDSGMVLDLMNTPPDVEPFAGTYLRIVGGSTLIVVLHAVVNAAIRSTGNTRGPMYISVGMNVVHLVLNWLLIFGHGGFPELGIEGAAYSTVISRLAALAFAGWLLWKTFQPTWQWREWLMIDRAILREVMRIGVPVSLTAVSWGFSQVVILRLVSDMGSDRLAAYAYLQTIQQWPWIAASAIAGGLGIRVSQLYGAGEHAEMYASLRRGIVPGMALVVFVSGLIYLLGDEVLSLFTSSSDIIGIAMPILALTIGWMPLRTIGLLASTSLNAVGEARSVGYMSVFGMWVLAAGGAYWLGDLAGYGLLGVFVAAVIDEIVRSSFFIWRWRRLKPQTHQSIPSMAERSG
ncbi:MATE family efflux transporter [Cohnella sp. GCM10027633]|uniref:MATE family efflux transporter n=1 Tax=unclassified Cohnella TaxID=2636738 RepID=UPI003624F681